MFLLIYFFWEDLPNKNKIELGLDYRIDSFINSSPDRRYWTQIGYSLSL
ncbi:hypothetical protein [Dokdonia sp.]